MIYFSSDHHFGHNNIIEYCNRPFKNADIMDRELIKNHNAVINDKDEIFFIGDFSLKTSTHIAYLRQIVKKLKGIKYLILGNHDALKPFTYIDIGFRSVHTLLEKGNIVMSHDPSSSCYFRDKIFICGHIHDLFLKQKNVINVSVEMWNYRPVSINEINNLSDIDCYV